MLNDMPSQPTVSERRDATEDEVKNLKHVVDSVPFAVWIALIASAAERFTFYAVSTPFRKANMLSSLLRLYDILIVSRELHAE